MAPLHCLRSDGTGTTFMASAPPPGPSTSPWRALPIPQNASAGAQQPSGPGDPANTALGAPDPGERPTRHLAPRASAGSFAPQPKTVCSENARFTFRGLSTLTDGRRAGERNPHALGETAAHHCGSPLECAAVARHLRGSAEPPGKFAGGHIAVVSGFCAMARCCAIGRTPWRPSHAVRR